jgi:hypothetical protein
MTMPALALLAAALLVQQTAPSANPESDAEGEDIVVRAHNGFTTMLFDRGNDGKLHNCRVIVSSGSRRLDAEACGAAPECFEDEDNPPAGCAPIKFENIRRAERSGTKTGTYAPR